MLAETNGHPDEAREYTKDPGVGELRRLSAVFDRTLREDRAEIERTRRERAEAEARRQRDMSCGFSM